MTLLDIIIGCENFLGWTPPARPGVPAWKARTTEVYKLKNAMATKPASIATIENLALALEYSRRKRLPIKSPITLLYRIPDALELANIDKPVSDLQAEIAAAIGWEKGCDDEGSLRWIHRLVRASGPGRGEVLQEWKAAGRG